MAPMLKVCKEHFLLSVLHECPPSQALCCHPAMLRLSEFLFLEKCQSISGNGPELPWPTSDRHGSYRGMSGRTSGCARFLAIRAFPTSCRHLVDKRGIVIPGAGLVDAPRHRPHAKAIIGGR